MKCEEQPTSSGSQSPLLRPRRRRLHLLKRLRDREYAQGSRRIPSVFHATRHLCSYVRPNATVVNIDKPNAFPRKFTPDGQHLIAVSASQTAVVIYAYRGVNVAGQLVNAPSSCSVISKIEIGSEELTKRLWQCLFREVHTVELVAPARAAVDAMYVNREFSLFTPDSRHCIMAATARIFRQSRAPEQFPMLFDVHQNNESLQINSNTYWPFENVMLCCIDVKNGVVCDTYKFDCDRILLTNACGVQLMGRRLMVFSIQHQTIHLFHIDAATGALQHVRSIGRCLYDDDELVLLNTPGVRCGRQQVVAMAETSLSSLKHRLLAHLYRQARGDQQQLALLQQQFDQLQSLKVWRVQMVCGSVLLLRYTHEQAMRQRDNGHVFSLLVFYDWQRCAIVSVHNQYSASLCQLYETHADLFKHPDGEQLAYACDINNNAHSRRQHEQFKLSVRAARGHDQKEVHRRILVNLPVNSAQFSPSPYLDLRLFSYDDKYVSPYERPRHVADTPIRLHYRDSGAVAFRMQSGVWRSAAGNSNGESTGAYNLIAYIWHPFDPLCVSMQRCTHRTPGYSLNLHLPAPELNDDD